MSERTAGRGGGASFMLGLTMGVLAVVGAFLAFALLGPAPDPLRTGAALTGGEPAVNAKAPTLPQPEPDTSVVSEQTDFGSPKTSTLPDLAVARAPDLPDTPALPEPSVDNAALDGTVPAAPAQPDVAPTVSPQPEAEPEVAAVDPVLQVPAGGGASIVLDGPAITMNAAPFEDSSNLPLIAVVLTDPVSGEVTQETLLSLDMPLTLAIAPDQPGAVELAAEAGLAGYEILAELPVAAPGSSGGWAIHAGLSDIEVADRTSAIMSSLWMSVGATGDLAEGAVIDENVLRGVIGVLERHGYAMIGQGAGDGITAALAGAFGVPYTGRDQTIGAGASSEQIYQVLDAAVVAAKQNGTAVVSGPVSLAMLQGLYRWGLEKGGREARLAPISAVIRRQAGG